MVRPVNEVGRWMVEHTEPISDAGMRELSAEEVECEWLLGNPLSLLEGPLSHTWIVFESREPLQRRVEYKESIYKEVTDILLQENARISSHDLRIIFLLVFRDKLYGDAEEVRVHGVRG